MWIWCLWCYSECISTPGKLKKYAFKARHIFQACPVWIDTQSYITSIIQYNTGPRRYIVIQIFITYSKACYNKCFASLRECYDAKCRQNQLYKFSGDLIKLIILDVIGLTLFTSNIVQHWGYSYQPPFGISASIGSKKSIDLSREA
jgi:hypothetical protein